ncbi:colicin release lysis protein [Escherichia coli]|nr:colicin release lysis protein [Escherichia coli]
MTRDVQGGTVAPSSSSELTGNRGSVEKIKGSLEILFFLRVICCL